MITTPRLDIRPFTIHDAKAFFDLTQDDAFNAFPITKYRQKSLEEAKDWILQNKGKFAVIEKNSGELIGMGGLTPWTWENENLVDVTYRLRSSAHGKGLGMELAEALVKYGFEVLKLPEITATITPDNIPSKRVAEKLGMKFDKRIILLETDTDLYRLVNLKLT